MKIFIITMDDPIHTIPFIKEIIDSRRDEIVGVAVSKGNRLTVGKKHSKIVYIFSLLLIMGLPAFISNSWRTVLFKIRKGLNRLSPLFKSPSILAYAEKLQIKNFNLSSPHSEEFLEELRRLQPDVIINQSQSILKKKLLSIPSIGVINRHNALLPKNRGRLTPFWVLYKREPKTGVSIHFVEEGIDSGDIIVQEEYDVSPKDNFNTLVKKNYEIAGLAILKALSLLETSDYPLIKNDDALSTYNSIPTFAQALKYRISRLFI